MHASRDLAVPGPSMVRLRSGRQRGRPHALPIVPVLDDIPDAVVILDTAGLVRHLNLSAMRLLGVARVEAIGRPARELLTFVDGVTHASVGEPVTYLLARTASGSPGEHGLLRRRDGAELPIDYSIASIRASARTPAGFLLLMRDASRMQDLLRRLTRRATHDGLTQLVNRAEFERRLVRLLAAMREGEAHALLYIDLDGFKTVNDTGGHAAGDRVLRAVAHRFRGVVRERDTLARLGGDEFGLLLEHCSLAEADALACKLEQALAQGLFCFRDYRFRVTASIGVTAIADRTRSLRAVLADADQACYAVKRRRNPALEERADRPRFSPTPVPTPGKGGNP